MTIPNPEELRELFTYDPETGELRWKKNGSGRNFSIPVGNVGTRGYLRVVIHGRNYMLHRVIWAFFHGAWPDNLIDHINGSVTDNRITNLRQATTRENSWNQRIAKNNTTGLKGVSLEAGRYRASIMTEQGKIHLGLFDTAEDAHEAYKLAADAYFGPFARHA